MKIQMTSCERRKEQEKIPEKWRSRKYSCVLPVTRPRFLEIVGNELDKMLEKL